MATSFKSPRQALLHSVPPTLQQATADHTSAGDSWTLTASLGQPPVGSLLVSPGSWCTRFCVSLQECSPVLCKFWQLHGGVNGNFLQEGLCHTPACCTQSACPCSGPLLTQTFSGDTQTWFWLSLCSLWALVYTRGT